MSKQRKCQLGEPDRMTGSSNNVYAKKYLVNYRVISTRDRSGQRVSEQFQLHDVTTENPDMIKNSEIHCKENRSHGGKCSFYSQIDQSDGNDIKIKSHTNKRYSKGAGCREPSLKKVRHDCLELEEVTHTGQWSEASPDASSDEERCQEYLSQYKAGEI